MAGESPANWPDSPSFAATPLTAPPVWHREEMGIEDYVTKISKFLTSQYNDIADMQSSISSGWLIDTVRVLNLEANTILADEIITNDFYLGSDGNGSIELSGSSTQMVIKDETGQDRVILGDLGVGSTNWGIQVLDAAGTVRLQAGTTTYIDGVILQNATVADGAITDLAGNKLTGSGFIDTTQLANLAVTNAKLDSISADKITLSGTLTCSTSGTAIDIEDSGLIHFSGGGDIVMDMSGTNMNFIVFRNASTTEKGYIFLNTSDHFKFLGASGVDVHVQAQGSGEVRLYASSSGAVVIGESNTTNLQIVARVDSDIIPDDDDTHVLGTASLRWADIRAVLVNGADFCYDNGWRDTEPNHVWSWADATDGTVKMNEHWEPVYWFHKDGNIQTTDFLAPDIPRREVRK